MQNVLWLKCKLPGVEIPNSTCPFFSMRSFVAYLCGRGTFLDAMRLLFDTFPPRRLSATCVLGHVEMYNAGAYMDVTRSVQVTAESGSKSKERLTARLTTPYPTAGPR